MNETAILISSHQGAKAQRAISFALVEVKGAQVLGHCDIAYKSKKIKH